VLATIRRLSAVVAISAIGIAAAWAADATGKWTWTTNFQGNQVTQTLELKQDGEKLTGSLTGRNNQKIEIKEGTAKGNEISFVVVRDRNGQEVKTVYKGKIDGDTLKGTITNNVGGQDRTREWTATRAK
jgi:hypothetical protein